MADRKRKRGAPPPRGKQKKSRVEDIGVGMRGIIVTCDTHLEHRTVQEALSVLGSMVDEQTDSCCPSGAGERWLAHRVRWPGARTLIKWRRALCSRRYG